MFFFGFLRYYWVKCSYLHKFFMRVTGPSVFIAISRISLKTISIFVTHFYHFYLREHVFELVNVGFDLQKVFGLLRLYLFTDFMKRCLFMYIDKT